jgi:predicted O-methyltransferase YrrM
VGSPSAADVDDYIVARLLGDDPAVAAARAANTAAGLPPIDVSDAQGKLLQLLASAIGARRILEVGTLGGVSTIYLARALPADGRLLTLEIDPHHAAVARGNVDTAGVGAKVDIRIGPAAATLAAMQAEGEAPFDLVFIDADKEGNVGYAKAALALSRAGSMIIVDNVVREGAIVDAASTDSKVIGTRALYDYVAGEPRLDATAIQTQGTKHWDGFMLAVVR